VRQIQCHPLIDLPRESWPSITRFCTGGAQCSLDEMHRRGYAMQENFPSVLVKITLTEHPHNQKSEIFERGSEPLRYVHLITSIDTPGRHESCALGDGDEKLRR